MRLSAVSGRHPYINTASHTRTHAVLLQNRDGALADVDLYYDYPGGRNLNIIKVRRVVCAYIVTCHHGVV